MTAILSREDAAARGLKRYFTGVPCKRGHVAERYVSDGGCSECKLDQSRRWRRENPERSAEIDASARERNLEVFKARVNRYHRENRDKIALRKKMKRESNLEESRRKEREIARSRLSTPQARLENSVSSGVHRGLTKGEKSSRRTFELLGYTLDDLCSHLESLFAPGMSWENYGRRGWHIDHIRPLASFNYETPDHPEFREAWSLTNLQPLWWHVNLSKHDKWEGPEPANDNEPKKDAA